MKIVFMGTPDFSAKVLEKLHRAHPVSAVVTSPDKPVGRGYNLQPNALKLKATELEIPVLEYEKVCREGLDDIRDISPDVIITAAFGQILTEEFLQIPKYGVLNVHASLLPKYRGASPIQQAIINGEKETGITVMRTVKAVDAGDILLQRRTIIGEKETAGDLFERLADLGGDAIIEAIDLLASGNAEFTPQDESKATYAKMISKTDGRLFFNRTARELDCFVRGMTPWPTAYTVFEDKILKVFETEIIDDEELFTKVGVKFMLHPKFDGDISKLDKTGIVVAADAKQGLVVTVNDDNAFLRLKQVQLEGAKRMSDVEFLCGRHIEIGTVLGE